MNLKIILIGLFLLLSTQSVHAGSLDVYELCRYFRYGSYGLNIRYSESLKSESFDLRKSQITIWGKDMGDYIVAFHSKGSNWREKQKKLCYMNEEFLTSMRKITTVKAD